MLRISPAAGASPLEDSKKGARPYLRGNPGHVPEARALARGLAGRGRGGSPAARFASCTPVSRPRYALAGLRFNLSCSLREYSPWCIFVAQQPCLSGRGLRAGKCWVGVSRWVSVACWALLVLRRCAATWGVAPYPDAGQVVSGR